MSVKNLWGLKTGFVPFFKNNFPGLFQDFFRTQIYTFWGAPKCIIIEAMNPYEIEIQQYNKSCRKLFLMKTLLQEFIDFQDFPGPASIFLDFPVLENARIINSRTRTNPVKILRVLFSHSLSNVHTIPTI